MEGKRTKNAIKNSIWGMIGQAVPAMLSFLTRKVFLIYLEVEYLGISETFLSLLSTLSLTELGFQTAVVFFLYQPLAEENINEINQLMNYYKKVYQRVAGIVLMGAIVLLPFIPHMLNGIAITGEIYVIYGIHVIGVVVTYLIAYKRALLYADQKAHISSKIDMSVGIVVSIAKILIIIILHNYIFYITLSVVQTIVTNLWVEVKCRRLYPYLNENTTIADDTKQRIWGKIKDILASRIASYIYACTDNLVISIFVNTIAVGYLANYNSIKSIINGLISAFMAPIVPTVGNLLVETKNKESAYETFLNLTYVRYFLATTLLAPMLCLFQVFICLWVGENYLLSFVTVVLIVADLYCSVLMGPCGTFLNALGMFGAEKRVAVVAAISNVVFSLVLVRKYEINGVIIGTVISQLVFWSGRFQAVDRGFFKFSPKQRFEYWNKNIIYVLLFSMEVVIGMIVVCALQEYSYLLRFVVAGLIIEGVNIGGHVLFLSRFREYRYLKRVVSNTVSKIIK